MNLYAIAAGTYASTRDDTTTVEPLSSVRCTGHISAISSSRFRSAGLRSPVTAILRSTRSRRAALPSPQSSQSLVANGATIPPDGFDADDAYLCKVRAAGGFPAYEMAHRMRLTATCARVVFPRLPVDAVSHVVAFAFHTGYY